MKTETLNYQKLNDIGRCFQKGREKFLSQKNLTAENGILISILFLLGKASMSGGLMPFGMAAYIASFGLAPSRLITALSILLGMASKGGWQQIVITGSGILLFNVLVIPFKKQKNKLTFLYASIGLISAFVPRMIMVYLDGMLLYDIITAVFYSGVVFGLTFIFRSSGLLLFNLKSRQVFSNEEMISLCIVASLALAGLGEFILFGISIRNILCALLILVFSYKCGLGPGAAVGTCVGLVASISSGINPLIIGTGSFSGILSGAFRGLGKSGAGLGFILGNVMLTIYLNGSVDTLIHLKEIIAAVVIFMAVPKFVIDFLTGKFNRNVEGEADKRSYSIRIKEMTIDKLNRFSRAFSEISKTFNEISDAKAATNKQELSVLFDRVADRVCKDCSLCFHCWDRNFYETYQVMFKIVEKLDEKGRIEGEDIPDSFKERCERLRDFAEAVNNVYEIFKVDMSWRNKVQESRALVSQQLEGLSDVISGLASEIDMNIQFRNDLEDIIIMELGKKGIKASEVMVYENRWGKYEINIFHKGCGGKRQCVTDIEKIVSEVTGHKMSRRQNECCMEQKGNICALRLVEEESYRVTTGLARVPKYNNDVSGDTYTFMNSEDGKYILAISDGMGSGQKAAAQSQAAVDMLESFIESGFDKDTAIKMINSILVLKSSDDSYATIDLSVIDLYDGNAEFVKIGAVPTYIKRGERVEALRSVSIPAGILGELEADTISKKVKSGDFIIMMSDGILDAFKSRENQGRDMDTFLSDIKSVNPQEIADMLLAQAKDIWGGKPQDDMMVLVAKVWRRAA